MQRLNKIIKNEVDLEVGSSNLLCNEAEDYLRKNWRNLSEVVHDEVQIKGFFGEYRWLSDFSQAQICLDGV